MEEPVRIEKTVAVPYVKHVPVPVPVYVPQPYPVEKKVFVPYKVYEKQAVPIIHRYPVEKIIRVPVPVPVEQPIGILVPYHVPVDKRVAAPPFVHPTQSYSELKELAKDSTNLLKHNTVKFPADNRLFKSDKSSVPEEDENTVSSSVLSPFPYNAEEIIPYGTRLSMHNKANTAEKQENHSVKESAQNSAQVQVITPAPMTENSIDESESITKTSSSEEVELKNEKAKDQSEASKEEMHNIVFPTERNDIDEKS